MGTSPHAPNQTADQVVDGTPIGLTRTSNHVYTWNDGNAIHSPLPSVTTILRVVDRSGPLVGWAKRETAISAIRNLDALVALRAEAGIDAAVNWLKAGPDHARDTAANRGTQIHRIAEQISRGQEPVVPEELAGYVAAYRGFLRDWSPRFVAAEQMVCSLRHGFAGQFDAIAEIAGERWLLDYKTSSGVYAEAALQLSAYGAAQFVGRPGDPHRYRVPRVTRFGVVHIQDDRADLVPVAVERSTFEAFLRALEVWRWTQGPAKTVIGRPVKREGYAA